MGDKLTDPSNRLQTNGIFTWRGLIVRTLQSKIRSTKITDPKNYFIGSSQDGKDGLWLKTILLAVLHIVMMDSAPLPFFFFE